MSRSLLLSVSLLAACHHAEPEPPAPHPVVQVVVAKASTVQSRVSVSGVLTPLPGLDVKVGSLVPGRVDRVFVAEGDRVKKGQPLAHVEAEPLKDRVTEAEAQRATNSAALANARTRLARAEKLFADGIASRQEVDDAHASVVAASSAVQQADAGRGTAGVQLDRATLRSPIDGVVAAILVPAGQPVDGNATPVVEVADSRELDLRAPIPASRMGEVTLGQGADVLGVAGRVVAIAPVVDTATSTVAVRVRLTNDGKLRGGLFVTGVLLGAPHDAIVLPRSALLPGDGGDASVVAVVGKDGAVSHRNVTAREAADGVEVTGISPGERVITTGGYALPDGTIVEIAP